MNRLLPGRHLYAVPALTGLLLVLAVRATAGECTPVIAAYDTVGWNSAGRTFLGKAVGQTFYAADTLMSRITLWRHPNDVDGVASHLFVTAVDTVNYDPPRPITQNILQDGPLVFVMNSDPPGLPIRMDFVLEPPLALPGPGTYAFFIQREGCDGGETAILAKQPGTYPYGTAWSTGRTSFLPCFLRSVDGWVDVDLCFEMEYCRDVSTPTRQESWGKLKLIYR
jgi:hypothetical protein